MLYDSIKKDKRFTNNTNPPDSEQNKLIFDLTEEIINFAFKNKLEYRLLGGLALALYFESIYRELADIDLAINQKDIQIWKKWFKDNNFNFKANKGFPNMKLHKKISLYKISNKKIHVEMYDISNIYNQFGNIIKNINNININLSHPKDTATAKKVLNRNKDMLDIRYYHLNN